VKKRKLSIATCQHDVCGNISINLNSILKQIQIAKSKHADIVHFSECNLTGYGGMDISEIKRIDFGEIQDALQQIRQLAGTLEIKVIVGSHHYDTDDCKPKNSLILINEQGKIEARYDKRILTGTDCTLDHLHYSHGKKPIIFMINGIRCGMLICHEWRYPELYREYKKLGVEVIFQSWYDGGLSSADYRFKGKAEGELILGSVRGYASNNYVWISGSNTSKQQSCFPSFLVQPDGVLYKKLARNKPSVLISSINLNQKFADPSFYSRDGFMH